MPKVNSSPSLDWESGPGPLWFLSPGQSTGCKISSQPEICIHMDPSQHPSFSVPSAGKQQTISKVLLGFRWVRDYWDQELPRMTAAKLKTVTNQEVSRSTAWVPHAANFNFSFFCNIKMGQGCELPRNYPSLYSGFKCRIKVCFFFVAHVCEH